MKNVKHVMIVLGCKPKFNGKPSSPMIARARLAVQLHKKNNYSQIILSGGRTRRNAPPEAAVMRVMLLDHLPHNKVISEIKSRSTVQNALFCWEIIKDKKPKSVTVVTSEMNKARVSYIFRKLYAHMGVSLKFEAAPDDYDPIEKLYYWIWELCARAYYKIFGIR